MAGMSSFDPKFTIASIITEDLTTIERAHGFVEAAALSKEWIHQMEARALILEAHHTTHTKDFEQLCPTTNRRTLQRDLSRLEELNLVHRRGGARQSLYSLNNKAL